MAASEPWRAGGVDAEGGVGAVLAITVFSSALGVLPLLPVDMSLRLCELCFESGGVRLCGRELFWIGVAGFIWVGEQPGNGEVFCCLRGLGEAAAAATTAPAELPITAPPGLVVPAN